MTYRAAPALLLLSAAVSLLVLAFLPAEIAPALRAALAFFLLGWFPGYALIRLAEDGVGHRRIVPPGLDNDDPTPTAGFDISTSGIAAARPAWIVAAPLAFAPIVSTALLIVAVLLGVPYARAAFLPGVVGLFLALIPRRRAGA